MDHLYAPWRMAYIRGEKSEGMGCVFCEAPDHMDEDALIVARGVYQYVILNRFPYNNGHLMVVPYAHVDTPEALSRETLLEGMELTNQAMAALRTLYNPPAFNLGANIGAAAGAGIAAHYHFHIVPRWPGDANFMTAVGETRVVPDTLENTWRELRSAWAAP
ncbi:MAG: HIT domain-containing protein [Anaerolineae bacterium]